MFYLCGKYGCCSALRFCYVRRALFFFFFIRELYISILVFSKISPSLITSLKLCKLGLRFFSFTVVYFKANFQYYCCLVQYCRVLALAVGCDGATVSVIYNLQQKFTTMPFAIFIIIKHLLFLSFCRNGHTSISHLTFDSWGRIASKTKINLHLLSTCKINI